MSHLMSEYSHDVPLSHQDLQGHATGPILGPRHQPFSFDRFVTEVKDQIGLQGLNVAREEHLLSGEARGRYFGLMEVSPKEGELITADEWRMLVGLRASHDQSVGAAIGVGRSVMVCSNLCFSADLAAFRTKQTTFVWDRLPDMIYQAVSKLPGQVEREQTRVEKLKGFEMKPRWGDAALVEIHRRRGLTADQLGRAVREWDKPSHEEFEADGHTAWRLEQAVTEAQKPTGRGNANLLTVQDRTGVASRFLDELVGMAA